MILELDLCNPARIVLVLHNCNKLVVLDPFLVPFHPVLNPILGIHHAQMLQLYFDLVPQSVFCRQMPDPPTFGNLYPHDPPIYKSCKRDVGGFDCILATGGIICVLFSSYLTDCALERGDHARPCLCLWLQWCWSPHDHKIYCD